MHVQKKFEVSERRACRAMRQPRPTQRYPSRKADRDRLLIERMIALSEKNPRYG
jgi:putative transposase